MADTKLTALTETTSPATSDDVYIVTTPGGTPASKRCTIANLRKAMSTPVEDAWTDYSSTATIVGWASFTTKSAWYKTIGKLVFMAVSLAGTSNSATTTISLPTTPALAGSGWPFIGLARDNGGSFAAAYFHINQSVAQVDFYKDAQVGGFTATGTKEVYCEFWYVTA